MWDIKLKNNKKNNKKNKQKLIDTGKGDLERGKGDWGEAKTGKGGQTYSVGRRTDCGRCTHYAIYRRCIVELYN